MSNQAGIPTIPMTPNTPTGRTDAQALSKQATPGSASRTKSPFGSRVQSNRTSVALDRGMYTRGPTVKTTASTAPFTPSALNWATHGWTATASTTASTTTPITTPTPSAYFAWNDPPSAHSMASMSESALDRAIPLSTVCAELGHAKFAPPNSPQICPATTTIDNVGGTLLLLIPPPPPPFFSSSPLSSSSSSTLRPFRRCPTTPTTTTTTVPTASTTAAPTIPTNTHSDPWGHSEHSPTPSVYHPVSQVPHMYPVEPRAHPSFPVHALGRRHWTNSLPSRALG